MYIIGDLKILILGIFFVEMYICIYERICIRMCIIVLFVVEYFGNYVNIS